MNNFRFTLALIRLPLWRWLARLLEHRQDLNAKDERLRPAAPRPTFGHFRESAALRAHRSDSIDGEAHDAQP